MQARTNALAFSLLCGMLAHSAGASQVQLQQTRQTVLFHPPKDLTGLDVLKSKINRDPNAVTVFAKTISFRVDPQQCFLYPAPEGFEYFAAGDLKPATKPGEPQLPVKTIVVELDKNTEVYGVAVTAGAFREVVAPVNLVPAPQLSGWAPDANGGKHVRDERVYALEKFFPGHLISYETGLSNERRYVFVHLSPVQYVPKSGKLAVVTEATVLVYYGVTMASSASSTSPPCVIIAPGALQSAAGNLGAFHTTECNGPAEVVTTESISVGYTAAPDPPFDGYKNSRLSGWKQIHNYNYILAKKIVSFLRARSSQGGLLYVTLLGDGLLVPPSYYYSSNGGSYDDWIPTDFFYSSPDYDFVPNFKIGRLSVSDAAEAASVVTKIRNWNAQWTWFGRVLLSAGHAHSYHYYCAEMNAIETVNLELLKGMGLTKCFHTDGAFTKTCTEQALMGGGFGILYHIGHGSGSSISMDDTSLRADHLMSYLPSSLTPVVLSVSCRNGAFDLDLMSQMSQAFPHSFGEAVLKSKAGGIAYFGGSRHGVGDGLYHYDYGNLIVTDRTYMIKLLHLVLESYKNGNTRLGDMSSDAFLRYVSSSGGVEDDVDHLGTLFQHVMLGDPVLNVPPQMIGTEAQKAACTAPPTPWSEGGMPRYTSAPGGFTANTDASSIEWKLIDMDQDRTLDRLVDTPPFAYTPAPGSTALYILRASTEAPNNRGYTKENWLFYKIGPPERMLIRSIAISVKATGTSKYASATVAVVNQTGSPVSGALLVGNWSGLAGDTDSGKTDRFGRITVSSNAVGASAAGKFTFCVDTIQLTGWTYDRQNSPAGPCASVSTP